MKKMEEMNKAHQEQMIAEAKKQLIVLESMAEAIGMSVDEIQGLRGDAKKANAEVVDATKETTEAVTETNKNPRYNMFRAPQ